MATVISFGEEFWRYAPTERGSRLADAVERVDHAFTDDEHGNHVARHAEFDLTVGVDGIKLRGTRRNRAGLNLQTSVKFSGGVSRNGYPWKVVGNTAQRQIGTEDPVLEHIELRAQGTEITWVLVDRPKSAGNLIFSIDTDARLTMSTDGRSVIAHDDVSGAGFQITEATLVDSSHRRFAVTAEIIDDLVQYRVPPAALTDLQFPVAIDPLITPFFDVYFPGTVNSFTRASEQAIRSDGRSLFAWIAEDGSLRAMGLDIQGHPINPDGNLLRDTRDNVSYISAEISLATFGANFVLVAEHAHETEAIVLDSLGSELWSQVLTPEASGSMAPAISCAGTQCAFLYTSTVAGGGRELRAAITDLSSDVPQTRVLDSKSVNEVFDATIATNGSDFVAVWSTTDGKLQRASFGLTLLTSPVSFATWAPVNGVYKKPHVSWVGDAYVITAVRDSSGLQAPDDGVRGVSAECDASGVLTRAFNDLADTNDACDVSAGGNGSRIVLSFVTPWGSTYAAELSRNGALTGKIDIGTGDIGVMSAITRVLAVPGTEHFAVSWQMQQWYYQQDTNYFQWPYDSRLVYLSGSPLAPDESVADLTTTHGYLMNISVAENQGRFLVVWRQSDNMAGTIRGVVVASDGRILTPNGLVLHQGNQTNEPSVLAAANGFLLFANDCDSRYGILPFTQTISNTGEVGLPQFLIESRSAVYQGSTIGPSGDGFAAAWPQNEPGVLSVARLDSNGVLAAPVVSINLPTAVGVPAIVSDGNRSVVAYPRFTGEHYWSAGSGNNYYRELTLVEGQLVVGDEQAFPGSGTYFSSVFEPQLSGVASGAGLVFAWNSYDDNAPSIEIAELSSTGTWGPVHVEHAINAQNQWGLVSARSGANGIFGYVTPNFQQHSFEAWAVTRDDGGGFSSHFQVPGVSVHDEFSVAVSRGAAAGDYLFVYGALAHDAGYTGYKISTRLVTSEPGDPDSDGDGYSVAAGHDCDDNNPNVWASCGACNDHDNDGYFVGCDAYSTLNGPDCNDAQATCNSVCEPQDIDQDGAFYDPICHTGTDCNDHDPDLTNVCSNVSLQIRSPLSGTRSSPVSIDVGLTNVTPTMTSTVVMRIDGLAVVPQSLSTVGIAGQVALAKGSHSLVVTISPDGVGEVSASTVFYVLEDILLIPAQIVTQLGRSADTLRLPDAESSFGFDTRTGLDESQGGGGDLPYSFIYDRQSMRVDDTLALVARTDDIRFKGRAGLDFVLTRTYSSDDAIAKRAQGRVDLALASTYSFIAANSTLTIAGEQTLYQELLDAASIACSSSGSANVLACGSGILALKTQYINHIIDLRTFAQRLGQIDYGASYFYLCKPKVIECKNGPTQQDCPGFFAFGPEHADSEKDECFIGPITLSKYVPQYLDATANRHNYGQLANRAQSTRHSEIRTGLGQGWSFNLPFIEFPVDGVRPGNVWFEGNRPKEFASLGAAVFPHESSLLWELSGTIQETGGGPCTLFGANGCDREGASVNRECLAFEMGPDSPVIDGRYPRIPADGDERSDLRFRLVINGKFYYFDYWGRPKVITDASHNNVVEIFWVNTQPFDNEAALSDMRIDHVVDSVGNRFDFFYLGQDDFASMRSAFHDRYAAAASESFLHYTDVVEQEDPPLLGEIRGPDLRIVYRYKAIPQFDGTTPGTGTLYTPPKYDETWALTGVEIFGSENRGGGAEQRIASYEYEYVNQQYFSCLYYENLSGTPICGRTVSFFSSPLNASSRIPVSDYIPLLISQKGPAFEDTVVSYDIRTGFEQGDSQGVVISNVQNVQPEQFAESGFGLYTVASRPRVSTIQQWDTRTGENFTGGRFEDYSTNLPFRGDVPNEIWIQKSSKSGSSTNGPPAYFNRRKLTHVNGEWQIAQEDEHWGATPIAANMVRSRAFSYDSLNRLRQTTEQGGRTTQTNSYECDVSAFRRSFDMPQRTELRLIGSQQVYRSYAADHRDDLPWLVEQQTDGSDIPVTVATYYADHALVPGCFADADPGRSMKPVAIVASGPDRSDTTCFAYDPYGNLLRYKTPEGSEYTFTYASPFFAATYNEPEVFLASTTHSVNGVPKTSSFASDFAGSTIRKVDELGNVFTSTRDGAGRPLVLSDPIYTVRFDYGTSTVPFNANTTSYSTPQSSWLPVASSDTVHEYFKTTGDASAYSNFRIKYSDYLARADYVSEIREAGSTIAGAARGSFKGIKYDQFGFPNQFQVGTENDSSRRRWTIERDALGRVTQKTIPARSSTATAQGLLTEVSESWTYDDVFTSRAEVGGYATLATLHTIDGDTRFYSDALGRIVVKAQEVLLSPSDVAPTSVVTRFDWNRRGLLESVIASNGDFVQMSYDMYGNLKQRNRGTGLQTCSQATPLALDGCIQESWTWTSTGKPTSYTDGTGLTTNLSYDGSNNISRVVDPAGSEHLYANDGAGRTVSHCLTATGACEYWTYSPRGDLQARTSLDGIASTFDYDFFHEVVATHDPATGGTRQIRYDAFGNVVANTDELGHTWTTLYDGKGRITAATEPRGGVGNRSFVTNLYGDVLQESYDADSRFNVAFRRDSLGRIVEQKASSLGVGTQYVYNAAGAQLQTTEIPRGSVWQNRFDVRGRRIESLSPEGKVNSFTYDFDNRLTSKNDGAALWTFSYYADGLKGRATNPNGGETRLYYNSQKSLQRVARDGIDDVLYAYVDEMNNPDLSGLHVRITDGAGDWVRLQFDYRGNTTKTTAKSGDVRTAHYNSRDNIEQLTWSNSISPNMLTSETRVYTANGRLQSVSFENGASRTFTYDDSNNLLTSTDEVGLVSTRQYALPLPLVTQFDPPDSPPTTFTYDGLGRRTLSTFAPAASQSRTVSTGYDDVNGKVTRTASGRGAWVDIFSPDGRLASRKSPTETVARLYGYDAASRLSSVTDETGHVTGYTYDGFGSRKATTVDAELNGESFTYDSFGRVGTVSDASGLRQYAYRDSDGALELVSHPDNSTTLFAYDSAKRMSLRVESSASGATVGAKAFAYDYLGQLSAVTETAGSSTRTVSYKRDTRGRLRAEFVSGSSTTVNDADYYLNGALKRINTTHFERSPLTGLVSSIYAAARDGDYASYGVPSATPDSTYVAIGLTYNEFGDLGSMAAGAGSATSWEWDSAGQVKAVVTGHNRRDITYWGDGKIQAVSTTQDGETNTDVFSYEAGRLSRAAGVAIGDRSYGYDGAGNVTSVFDNLTSSTLEQRTYDSSNRLTALAWHGRVDGANYDGRGRLSSLGAGPNSRGYVHDVFGRLTQTTAAGATLQQFTYDAADRLSGDQNVQSGRSRSLEYFGAIATRVSGSDGGLTNVIPHPETGDALATYGGGNQYFAITVGQQVVEELDAAGAHAGEQVLGAYGDRISGVNSHVPFGFQGYYEHVDSDLKRSFARTYDGAIGAFTSADPLSGIAIWPESTNRWRAFSGDPLNVRDRFGLWDSYDGGSITSSGSEQGGLGGGLATAGVGVFVGTGYTGVGAIVGAAIFVAGEAIANPGWFKDRIFDAGKAIGHFFGGLFGDGPSAGQQFAESHGSIASATYTPVQLESYASVGLSNPITVATSQQITQQPYDSIATRRPLSGGDSEFQNLFGGPQTKLAGMPSPIELLPEIEVLGTELEVFLAANSDVERVGLELVRNPIAGFMTLEGIQLAGPFLVQIGFEAIPYVALAYLPDAIGEFADAAKDVYNVVRDPRTGATVHTFDDDSKFGRNTQTGELVHGVGEHDEVAGSDPKTAPPINAQKQAGHVPGTPQFANRIAQGKPTSAFRSAEDGNALTREAWLNGTPLGADGTMRLYDFGYPVGVGPSGGGYQTQVRVSIDGNGTIHGSPWGPVFEGPLPW